MHKLLLTASLLLAAPVHAEQYLGKPGNQGAAAGAVKYEGSYVGYFKTKFGQ